MIVYPKGTKGFCKQCDDLIFVFCKDAHEYDRVCASLFSDEGQGPWQDYETMKCRKCGFLFDMQYNKPRIDISEGLQ